MKKLFLCAALLIGIAGVSLFAWEPNDLTKYPDFTKAGDFLLNFGVGFDYPGTLGGDYIFVPPIRGTLDYNIAIGEKKLPFFIGAILGYSGYGHRKADWFFHKISIGGRFGYHFNWGIDKLDTYAVTTAGWMIYAGDGFSDQYKAGWPLFGMSFGGRYFINNWFGFWAEAGYSSFSMFDIGLAFKF